MSMINAEMLQGRSVRILDMALTDTGGQLELTWKASLGDTLFQITFHNVSRLSMKDVWSPVEIQGFMTIDHSSSNGWDKDSSYEVRDFEDDLVRFFCESFEIGA